MNNNNNRDFERDLIAEKLLETLVLYGDVGTGMEMMFPIYYEPSYGTAVLADSDVSEFIDYLVDSGFINQRHEPLYIYYLEEDLENKFPKVKLMINSNAKIKGTIEKTELFLDKKWRDVLRTEDSKFWYMNDTRKRLLKLSKIEPYQVNLGIRKIFSDDYKYDYLFRPKASKYVNEMVGFDKWFLTRKTKK